jgi:hypothetical protein
MKANQEMERVYELLEQFDFIELTETDKTYVLSHITEDEYKTLRKTLMDLGSSLSNSEDLLVSDLVLKSLMDKHRSGRSFIKLLKKPVQFYKIAASVILLLGIYTVIQYTTLTERKNSLALNDTLYIHKTDTVYSKLADTVRIIKEKIIYVSRGKDDLKPAKLLSTSGIIFDSTREISPEDIDKIRQLTSNSPVSKDTLIRD